MALDRLDLVGAREPSIAIHDERDVLRYPALSQGPNEQFPQLVDRPLDRRGL
jgi:hypothetical protein